MKDVGKIVITGEMTPEEWKIYWNPHNYRKYQINLFQGHLIRELTPEEWKTHWK